jgi:AcrR family transcriptional regulator
MADFDSTQTSRARLLASAKTLFAKNGYEQTSTATIVRDAGTSESQLVRYFGGKAGLLEAIFNDSWSPLIEQTQKVVASAGSSREAVSTILRTVIESFGNDHELAFIFLFEGRRIRTASHEVQISKGFQQFNELICSLIRRGQEDGSFRLQTNEAAVAAALMGAAEGMIRERLVAERSGKPKPFNDAEIGEVFAAIMSAL